MVSVLSRDHRPFSLCLLQSNFNGVIIIVVPKFISIYPNTNMPLLFQHCTFTPYPGLIVVITYCHPLAHAWICTHFICLSHSLWGEGVGPSSLLPSTGQNVCAGISTCWWPQVTCWITVPRPWGGGMGQGVLSWWLLVVMATASESTN